MNRQQLIGADAEAAIAKFFRDRCQIGDVPFQAIDKNEIVARPMHLGKFEFHNLYEGARHAPLHLIKLNVILNVASFFGPTDGFAFF
jgi:hypothetical protein